MRFQSGFKAKKELHAKKIAVLFLLKALKSNTYEIQSFGCLCLFY